MKDYEPAKALREAYMDDDIEALIDIIARIEFNRFNRDEEQYWCMIEQIIAQSWFPKSAL